MSKYWLISDEDARQIIAKFDHLDGVGEMVKTAHEIRHTFDTGLHKTDCVPDDFKDDSNEPQTTP